MKNSFTDYTCEKIMATLLKQSHLGERRGGAVLAGGAGVLLRFC